MRPKTGDHDIEVKVNRAREFLEHKDKVIVTVIFRGRELAHIEEGRRVIDGSRPAGGRVQGRGRAGPSRPPHDLHAGAEVGPAWDTPLTR